jgi:hypothetical protein
MPDYKTRDPKGWCGNPARGAALGRANLYGDSEFAGKLTLRRVYLNSGGYDSLGTYWGHGTPLYWYASDDGTVDGVVRARSRVAAKDEIREDYPNARFWR